MAGEGCCGGECVKQTKGFMARVTVTWDVGPTGTHDGERGKGENGNGVGHGAYTPRQA